MEACETLPISSECSWKSFIELPVAKKLVAQASVIGPCVGMFHRSNEPLQ